MNKEMKKVRGFTLLINKGSVGQAGGPVIALSPRPEGIWNVQGSVSVAGME